MDETGQSADALGRQTGKKLIFICSIELYDTPLKPVLKPYRKAADVIEYFNLILTIPFCVPPSLPATKR